MTKAILFAAAALALAACAGPHPELPVPGEAQRAAGPLQYDSAFDGYRPFAEQGLANWRKANEDVGMAGGHHR